MRTRKMVGVFAALCALSLGLAACGGDDDTTSATVDSGVAETTEAAAADGDTHPADGELTKVKLQLQWFTQAQFAGYYAAVEKGFFKEEHLDVEIIEGGVDIVPQQQLADGQVDFALSWVPKALASRRGGRRHCQRGPDLPAVGNAAGVLQGEEHHQGRRLQGQEDR